MDSSTEKNEAWLLENLTVSEDAIERVKTLFTLAFVGGQKTGMSMVGAKVMEQEWDKALIIIRDMIESGVIEELKEEIRSIHTHVAMGHGKPADA